MRIALLASGNGSNLEALAQAIDDGRVDATIGLVVTDRFAPAVDKAKARGITVAVLPREGLTQQQHDGKVAEILQLEKPDLVVLAGYMRILGKPTLDAFPGRVINIHPSLLPAFKGAHGIRDAMAAGVGIMGCTTHVVTAELDGGPLLLQAAIPVSGDAEAMTQRIHALEHQILPRTVQLFAEGRVRVDGGRATILPGDSWREAAPGAIYSEGF